MFALRSGILSAMQTLISPRQLHERWSFHPESIRRMIREGRLPAVRIGKHIRISLTDVEAFEHANRLRVTAGGAVR